MLQDYSPHAKALGNDEHIILDYCDHCVSYVTWLFCHVITVLAMCMAILSCDHCVSYVHGYSVM